MTISSDNPVDAARPVLMAAATRVRLRLFIVWGVVAALIGGSYVYQSLADPGRQPDNVVQGSLNSDAPPSAAFTDRLVASLQARLRQTPGDARAYSLLGAAYLQKARETADPSYYGKAEAVLRKGLELQPADFEMLASMGVLALARHQFRVALDDGLRARALNPKNARTLGVIADAQIELGDYPAAVQSVQQMVDTRPDMSSYARVSYARELHGDRDGALRAMRQAAEAGSGVPENRAWTQAHVGLLLFNRGDLDGAQREYESALEAPPDYVPAQAGIARVLAARGQLSEAIAIYERVARIMPLGEYVIALADCYTRAGRAADAQQQYELVGAIAQLQRANGVDTDLEMALFEADQATVQSETLARARRVYAERPTVYAADVLAWTLYQSGKYAEAQPFAQAALKLNTQDSLLWFHAGMIDARLGQQAEARSKLEHALDLNPYFSLRWSPVAQQTLTDLRAAH